MSDEFEGYSDGEAALIWTVIVGWLIIFCWHAWVAIALLVGPPVVWIIIGAAQAYAKRPLTEKRLLRLTLRDIKRDQRRISRKIRRL